MEQIARDIRMALRGFRRTPTFPIAVITILAVSIGAAVAMFTTLRAVLIQPLPVISEERLAIIAPYKIAGVELSPSATDLPQLRRELKTVSALAGVAHWGSFPSPYVDGERTLTLNHADVSANYFEVLGAKALLGRLLRAADEEKSASPVMVISYKTWQSRFGGDTSIVGRKVVWPYTRLTFTIVGVAPAGLDYPLSADCWTAMDRADTRQVLLVARLAPGVSIQAAQQEVFNVSKRMKPAQEFTGASAVAFRQAVVGNVEPAILAISAAVVLLLLIASVNIGNLFLARAVSRARELFVRRALGATYGSIVRQLVAESAILAVIGGATGVVCSIVFLRALLHFAPSQLPRLDNVNIGVGLVAITIAVTTVSAIVFGLIPSLLAARSSSSTLAAGGRSSTHGRRQVHLRDALVMTQVAIAVVLLAVAGLVSGSLLSLQRAKLGYNAEQLAIAVFAWDATKFASPGTMTQWGQQMEQLLRKAPGIAHVSPVLIPPFLGESVWHTTVEAESGTANGANVSMDVPLEIGGTEYFQTMGIPIQRGRGFTAADEDSMIKTIVVSESVARKLWLDADPIGKRLRIYVPGAPLQRWSTVVGVVPDTRFRSLRNTSSTVYLPWRQVVAWQGMFAVRTTRNTKELGELLQKTARKVDPTIVLGDLQTMESALDVPLSTPRFTALLIVTFGSIALFLASVGLYGVMSASVREQSREIGIRSALGATPARAFLTVVRHGFLIASAGAIVGLVVAVATTRSIRGLLYNITPTDPVALTSAAGVLILVAVIAASFPARHAANVDPMRTLRNE